VVPAWTEGFDELYRVAIGADGEFEVTPVERPAAPEDLQQ